jgi:hypothetical protein
MCECIAAARCDATHPPAPSRQCLLRSQPLPALRPNRWCFGAHSNRGGGVAARAAGYACKLDTLGGRAPGVATRGCPAVGAENRRGHVRGYDVGVYNLHAGDRRQVPRPAHTPLMCMSHTDTRAHAARFCGRPFQSWPRPSSRATDGGTSTACSTWTRTKAQYLSPPLSKTIGITFYHF